MQQKPGSNCTISGNQLAQPQAVIAEYQRQRTQSKHTLILMIPLSWLVEGIAPP